MLRWDDKRASDTLLNTALLLCREVDRSRLAKRLGVPEPQEGQNTIVEVEEEKLEEPLLVEDRARATQAVEVAAEVALEAAAAPVDPDAATLAAAIAYSKRV